MHHKSIKLLILLPLRADLLCTLCYETPCICTNVFFQFLVPYSKSPLSSSMGANQKPAKIPQNEEVDRIELRKNDESARINLEKAKGKYSDKMKTLKTKMKKVKEEQKDLETNLIKFNAFVKEKQLKVKSEIYI